MPRFSVSIFWLCIYSLHPCLAVHKSAVSKRRRIEQYRRENSTLADEVNSPLLREVHGCWCCGTLHIYRLLLLWQVHRLLLWWQNYCSLLLWLHVHRLLLWWQNYRSRRRLHVYRLLLWWQNYCSLLLHVHRLLLRWQNYCLRWRSTSHLRRWSRRWSLPRFLCGWLCGHLLLYGWGWRRNMARRW